MLKWLPLLAVPWLYSPQPASAQAVTGPPTNLTSGSYVPDLQPRLNLNATKIVWTNQKGDFDLTYTYDNLYVMNLDGTGKFGPLQMQSYAGGNDNWAALSPDGTKVVCQKTGDWTTDPAFICMAVIDPITPTQMTLQGGVKEHQPTWSSDGTKIAFVSNITGTYQLFALKPEVENDPANVRVQLTNWADGAESAMPMASPDGKVLFVKQFLDGNGYVTSSEIWKVDLADSNGDGEGNNLTQITNIGGIVSSPSQPTVGGRIYFQMAARDGVPHVFSVNASGGDLHQVTGGAYSETTPNAAQDKLVVSYIDTAANGAGNSEIGIYSLSSATANGTVSGTFTGAAGAPAAGTTVNAYDGATLKATATTNASGAYTLSLPPGGYTLEFVTTDAYTVTRSVTVASGGTLTQDAFTTPTAAPRPTGLIATIKGANVLLRWHEAPAPSSGFSLVGYNVYRAPSEAGPWTKVNTTAIDPGTVRCQYTDTAPGNLATAFYKASTVTSDGINTKESAFTSTVQAANNLMFNGDFEQVDTNGQPIGWKFNLWGGNGTGGTDTTVKAEGTRSLSLKAGDSFGAMMFETPVEFYMPAQPGVKFVQGMWGKFKDTQTTWPLALKLALHCVNDYIYWYPNAWDRGPDLGPWDTNGLTNSGGDTDWAWLSQTDGATPYEVADGTRFSVLWPMDALATANSSTAYADDVTYQVQRIGATGWVMGRIIDTKGNLKSGVTVECGGKSIVTNGKNTFVLKDVPTGPQTLTIKNPGQPDYSVQIGNYGGYRMPQMYVVPAGEPLTVTGTVYLPDGKPCAGADVRLVATDSTAIDPSWGPSGAIKYERTTTTDASGKYTFTDSEAAPISTSGQTVIVAHKNGYVSNNMWKLMGTSGTSSGNDVTLIQPDIFIQIPKTSTPPTIDGTVNLATEWAGAQPVQMNFPANPLERVKTMMYSKWDNNNMYFAFVADEPNPAGIFAPTTGHDGGMWGTDPYWNGDDLFELRIDAKNGAGTGLGYEWWQIQLNSIDVTLDIEWRFIGPFEWGIGGETGVQTKNVIDTTGKKWYQEVQLPFSGLATTGGIPGATPAVGEEWYCIFSRQRHQPLPTGENINTGRAIVRFVNAVTPVIKGDINGDGVVDSIDVVLAMRIAAGTGVSSNLMDRGDVNSSGKIDMTDVSKIARKANGLDSF